LSKGAVFFLRSFPPPLNLLPNEGFYPSSMKPSLFAIIIASQRLRLQYLPRLFSALSFQVPLSPQVFSWNGKAFPLTIRTGPSLQALRTVVSRRPPSRWCARPQMHPHGFVPFIRVGIFGTVVSPNPFPGSRAAHGFLIELPSPPTRWFLISFLDWVSFVHHV